MTSFLLRTAAKRAASATSCRREICRALSSATHIGNGSSSITNQLASSPLSSTCHALTSRPLAATAGVPAVRTFAAAATADASGNSSSSSNSSKESDGKDQKEKKKAAADEPNIFLDNIGKLFLGAIGAIILALVRSSRATSNRTALRDYIENHALLDPLEIDDLRVANSELTVEVYERIMADVYAAFPGGRASYEDFVSVVMTTMKGLKGEAFTIQIGHLIDRVAIAAIEKEAELEKQNEGAVGSSASDASEMGGVSSIGSNPLKRQLPLPLLFTTLSLALQSDVTSRVRLLFDALQKDSASAEEGTVTEADIIKIVDYLQRTCQLVPDAQIVQTETKYPVQTYREGSPAELVGCAKKLMEDDGLLREETRDAGRYDIVDFHRILRSKQVCAWGECYLKTKNIE
mmetsp:Transcript_13572/g.38869  ORF Transcript_13572/g.38869 Transcript_13572/m.38869 type:complete len:405 (-) Transcript_13572:366-1580(-)